MAGTHLSAAIVGAGPAGSTAANALLLNGCRNVGLIDRERFPRDKSCGDALGGGVIPIMKALQLDDLLNGRRRITRLAMHVNGLHVDLDTERDYRPSPLGFVIPRIVFDAHLKDAAIRRGALDLTGWTLKSAARDHRGWTLSLSCLETEASRTITSDVLIGADGARSRVRRILGTPFNSDHHTWIAIRAYVDAPPVHFGYQRSDVGDDVPRPGYAWLFGDGTAPANIGLATGVVTYKRQRLSLRDALTRYHQQTGLDTSLSLNDSGAAILPLASQLPQIAYPDVAAALIGDAASMINPLTGEGIFYGMYAALRLGEILARPLTEHAGIPRALATFQDEFLAAFAGHFRGTLLLRRILEVPTLQSRLAKALQQRGGLHFGYVEYVMGLMPPRRPTPLHRLALASLLPGLLREV